MNRPRNPGQRFDDMGDLRPTPAGPGIDQFATGGVRYIIMLRHGLILSLLILPACTEESTSGPTPTVPVVDRTGRPAAPIVESRAATGRAERETDLLLRAVPGNALLCAHLPDMGQAWSRLSGTVYGALVGGLDFVDVSLRMQPLYERFRTESAEPGMPTAPPWSDVEHILQSLHGEVMVSLLDLDDLDAPRPDVRALAGVSVEGAGSETRRLIDFFVDVVSRLRGVFVKKSGKVWAIRSSDSRYTFEVGVDKDVAMFGIGEGTVAPALEGLHRKTPEFAMSSMRCFKPNDIARFRLNTKRVLERYAGDLPATLRGALRATRLDRIRSVSGSMRIDDRHFVMSTFYDSPGGHDLLTRFLANNPVDYSILEQIPGNLASFSLFTFSPSWLLRNLRIGLPPEQAGALRDAIHRLEGSGMDLSEETLSTFGPQCAQIGLENTNPKRTGAEAVLSSLTSSAWLIQVRDTKLVHRLIDQISAFIPARRRYRIGRDEAVTFELGLPRVTGLDLDPSIAVTPNYMYLALSEHSLRRALECGTPESAKRHRRQIRSAPGTVSSVTFDDMKSPGMFGTAILTSLATLKGKSERDPVVARMIQLEAAMSNLSPAVAYTTADDTGVFSRTRSPSAGLSGIGGITGISIVASIAIPNLLKARTAANESAAISTLRQIRSAQEQCRLRLVRDDDQDEHGEYGFLSDLMHPKRGEPLIAKFPGADGRYLRNGYIFRAYLPGRGGKPIGESGTSSQHRDVDANFAEEFRVVVAWPVQKGKTGRRAFVLNTDGDIFYCSEGAYGGRYQPEPDILCFEPGNMVSRPLQNGVVARDGLHWHLVR